MEEKELKMIEIPESLYKMLMRQAASSCKVRWMNQKLVEFVEGGDLGVPFSQQEYSESVQENDGLLDEISSLMRTVVKYHEKKHGKIISDDELMKLRRKSAEWN